MDAPESEKLCLFCEEPLHPDLYGQTRFCSRKCQNANWYQKNKAHHRRLYEEDKRKWHRSDSGRKAGISIYYWRKLPRSWR